MVNLKFGALIENKIKLIVRSIALLAVLFLISPIYVQAQEHVNKMNVVSLSFQKIDIGRGLQLNYQKVLNKKWQFEVGLYYHFNTLPDDDQSHAYHNRGWAENWYNHFGLNLAVNRTIFTFNKNKLFAFYNFHMLNMGFREKDYAFVFTQDGELLYRLIEGDITAPSLTFENSIGIGVSTYFTENIGFKLRGGIGASIYTDKEYIILRPYLEGINYAGFAMFSVGAFYAF